MAGLAPVELTTDCAACGLEGGVVEVYDALVPACRFGIPAATRCKLCATERQGSFDGTPRSPLREVPANRCPACVRELPPSAIDERACPSCGARATLEETRAPVSFSTLADLERALDAWAERESFASRDALARATFVEPDLQRLFEALSRRERIGILADPFANMGIRTTGGREGAHGGAAGALPAADSTKAKAPNPARSSDDVEPLWSPAPTTPAAPPALPSPLQARTTTAPLAQPLAPPLPPPEPPPPSAPPRALVYPLVSVIVADGEVRPEELELVDRFLQGEGLAPLAPHELCVHHPSEVAHFVPRDRREHVVKLMCETAAIDGMPDESERRVIRAYATAWDVDDEKLEFWMWGYETMNTSLARQLFLKLRRFVLSARWGEDEGRG